MKVTVVRGGGIAGGQAHDQLDGGAGVGPASG